MVRIEMKKIAEGQVMLAIEAKKETPDEVLTCAARGFVGVARNLLGPMSSNPQFAEEISRGRSCLPLRQKKKRRMRC